MGKAAKEHRKKVAKRNAKLAQQKSGMQKAFDMLIQEQLNKLKENELTAQIGDQELDMTVVEEKIVEHAFKFTPNPEESAKINKEFQETEVTEEPQTEA
jgi:membrane-bound lytic murein transglycosylase MltF